MANNIVGFIGTESYEIILYLSRVFHSLGKKVLMVDYSYTGSLAICIPVPLGLNARDDVIDYRKTDFTMKELSEDMINEYDDILINFEFNFSDCHKLIKNCNHLVFVTDQQKHNIGSLDLVPEFDIDVSRTQLIIKNFVESKIDKNYIKEGLKNTIFEDNVYLIEQDDLNTKSRILVQFDTKFTFKRISKSIKEYLKDTVKILYKEIPDNELKKAYKLAEGGN